MLLAYLHLAARRSEVFRLRWSDVDFVNNRICLWTKKNEESPLDCDLLIIDEASMIDTLLMHHLLTAIPVTATFIMVGDVNQLPSVGAGNVLKDIIDSGISPVVQLNEIFRQAKESSIIVNAHKINEGIIPNLKSNQDKVDDFYSILLNRKIPRRYWK